MRPFGETIFATLSRLAAETGAINLGQGFPEGQGPRSMRERAAAEALDGDNQYAPLPGTPALREAICAERERRTGQAYDPVSECLVTVGATEAIAAAVLGLLEPGRTALLIEPFYDSYRAAVALAGGRHETVSLVPDSGGFRLDTDALERVGDVDLILLNTPHNPTGKILREEELAAIADVAKDRDAIVVADEVYERLAFAGPGHQSIAALPDMRERTLVVSSAGKTFNATGWKTGWALGPSDLIEAVRTVKQFLTFVGTTPVQPAVAHALNNEDAWVEGLRGELAGNEAALAAALKESGARVYRAEAGYFLTADISPWGLGDATQAARLLPEKAGVVAVPVSAFVDDPEDPRYRNLLRFGFSKSPDTIAEAAERLAHALG